MKLKTNKLSAWLAALAFVVMTPMAQAMQFVDNGEFFNPIVPAWERTGPADFDIANRPVGAVGSGSAHFLYLFDSKLTQFVGSLNELTYNIEFYLKFEDLTGFTAAVTDALDANLLSVPDINLLGLANETVADGWVRYYGTFSGIEELELRFIYDGNPTGQSVSGIFLDGVSITQVPEPGSLALVGLALAGIAVVRRRKA